MLIGRLSDLLGVPAEAVFDLLASQKRQLRRGVRGDAEGSAEGQSEYEASVAGMPAGLVAAMETLFGLLLQHSECWRWVDDVVARGAGHLQTWKELYRVLLDVREEVGEYSLGEVVARCESATVCELVDRAGRRATGISSASAGFQSARDRLASELGVLRMAQVREHLAPEVDSGEQVFADLVRMARGQRSVLPPEARWNSPACGGGGG